MRPIQISTAGPSDLFDIERLSDIVQALHADARPDVFRMPVDSIGRRDFFAHALSDPAWHLWVANLNGQTISYLLAERMVKDGPIRTPHVEGHIHQVCVNPDAQKQGIGRAMVLHACQFFENLHVDRITVAYWGFNNASRALFTKTGFNPVITTAERQTS